MTIKELHNHTLFELEEGKVLLTTLDENNEEVLIELEDIEHTSGDLVLGSIDTIIDYDMKRKMNFIQECIDRVPTELQTEETFELIKIMFDLKDK